MHTLGKVLAFLVVITAALASVFTAKLVVIRNDWTRKVLKSKENLAKVIPKNEELERQIEGLKNEVFRNRDLWGGFWTPAQTNILDQNSGTLQVNLGSQTPIMSLGAQIGVRENTVMYGFELLQDGTVVYRGSFVPAQIAENITTLKPNFRINPDEVREWQNGMWRWRNQLPTGYADNFEKQLTTLIKLDETLADRLRTLEGQKQRLAQAGATLKLREAELVGGEPLDKKAKGGIETREGLVAALSQDEESRNKELREVDELRRQVRAVQAEIDKLQADNTELAGRLPQPDGVSSNLTQKK